MILLVDDEKRRMESYVEELRLSGYEVEIKSDVDSALDFFNENYKQIELLILDIMMPAGNVFENVDTKYGLRTGIIFYKKIRNLNLSLPIIIFTNVSNEAVEKKISLDQKSLFLQKQDFLPFQLVDELEDFIKITK